MARLIPSTVDDRTPPGERDVFDMLARGPDEWVVLHSLDLSPWNHGLRTEIDFLVFVPDVGLLCVEVKSHEAIGFVDDCWVPHTMKRSPFKQAADGRYAFYRRFRDLAPRLNKTPVVHCCIFPRASFDVPPNMSIQPWEVIDARCFGACRTGMEFGQVVKEKMRLSIAADDRLQALSTDLSRGQLQEIVELCMPVRRRRPDAREEIIRREEEAEKVLRKQQQPVLTLCSLNSQVVVSGGAGTGKTLLAMEVARRAAENGRRVAFLCFNRMVGIWLQERMGAIEPPLPNLVVGRAFSVLADMADLDIPPDPPQAFWDDDFPSRVEERLTDPDFQASAIFDYIVVDEAQDLLARPRLWHCLMACLAGGESAGSFALFGDFENQLMEQGGVATRTLERVRGVSRPTQWHLVENCRNYAIIGSAAVQLAGFQRRVYSGFMRTGGSVENYDIAIYNDLQEQRDTLRRWLDQFRAEGYLAREIVILSFCSDSHCAAKSLAESGVKLRPAWQSHNRTGYASVQAFKGMESKVVILTDLKLDGVEFHRHLIYTGMTRATESVRVLCESNSRSTLREWLTEGENQ